MQDEIGVPPTPSPDFHTMPARAMARMGSASSAPKAIAFAYREYVVPVGRSDLPDAIDQALAGATDAITLRSGMPLSPRSMVESLGGNWHLSLRRYPSLDVLERLRHRLSGDKVKIVHLRVEENFRHLGDDVVAASRDVINLFVSDFGLELLILSGPEGFVDAVHRAIHGGQAVDVVRSTTATKWQRGVETSVEAARAQSGRRRR